MKEFFRKQAYKFQQFMIGRYGIDKLWSVLLIFFFVITLLANAFYKVSKITYYAIEIMALVLVVFAIFRVFSKNIEARRAENAKWLKFENSVKGFFKFQNDKFKQRKTHKFVKCKGCKKTLRLPRHKGKINVTCPHCHTQFVVNTGKKATNNKYRIISKKGRTNFVLPFCLYCLFGFNGFYFAPCAVNLFARCAFVSTNSNVIFFLFL